MNFGLACVQERPCNNQRKCNSSGAKKQQYTKHNSQRDEFHGNEYCLERRTNYVQSSNV